MAENKWPGNKLVVISPRFQWSYGPYTYNCFSRAHLVANPVFGKISLPQVHRSHGKAHPFAASEGTSWASKKPGGW